MFRYEQKYLIDRFQYEELKRILEVMANLDKHTGVDGQYMIRSLYLDDMYRSAYNEKLDGVYQRKKYRIRVYNCSDDVIHMECKHKAGAYINKESFAITKEEFESIIAGEPTFLLRREGAMAKELYVDFRSNVMKPAVIVDYEREPYVFDAGTVRITFDKNVRACGPKEDLFSKDIPSYSVLASDKMILEIKFTGYLPERIRQIFKVRNYTQISASKYCMCVDKINEII